MNQVAEKTLLGAASFMAGLLFYVLLFTGAGSELRLVAYFVFGTVSVTCGACCFYLAGREYDRAFLEEKIRRQADRDARREETWHGNMKGSSPLGRML